MLHILSMKELSWGSAVDRTCTVVPGSFSVFLALLVAASVGLFKKLRTQTFYLVVFQAIAECIFNMSIIAFYNPPVHGNWECQYQGWMINFGIMSSIFFSGAIAGHMYLSITRRNYKFTQTTLLKLTGVIIVAAGLIAAIPYTTHQYDDLNANCWIAEGEYGTSVTSGIIMRFATHYGIIWAVCLYCLWCYKTIFKFVRDLKLQLRTSVLRTNKGPSELERTVYRLQYYPAILIFCWLGITCCRVYSSLYPRRSLPVWALCTGHAVLNTQGFLNGVIFFSYRSVWIEWVKLLGLEPLVRRWEAAGSVMVSSSAGTSSSTSSNTYSIGLSTPAAKAVPAAITHRRSFGNGDHDSSCADVTAPDEECATAEADCARIGASNRLPGVILLTSTKSTAEEDLNEPDVENEILKQATNE